jgi:hypothetical protein
VWQKVPSVVASVVAAGGLSAYLKLGDDPRVPRIHFWGRCEHQKVPRSEAEVDEAVVNT